MRFFRPPNVLNETATVQKMKRLVRIFGPSQALIDVCLCYDCL
jgi:hypothetical protein